MKITNEMLEKTKTARTSEELLELAKAENIEMTADEAAKAFAELHKTGELSDDELDNVAGGCSKYESGDSAKFSVGQRVCYVVSVYLPHEGTTRSYYYGTVIDILPKENGVFQIKVQMDKGEIEIYAENELRSS